MAIIEPTLEQLQQAWLQRRRPGWPDTFDQVMADPLCSRMVRMQAALIARGLGETTVVKTPAVLPPTPPFPDYIPPAQRRQQLPTLRHHDELDRKRAASGERDDD